MLVIPGDTVAFYLYDSDSLDVVYSKGNRIDFYIGDDLSTTPASITHDVNFRVKVLAVSVSYFRVSHVSPHNEQPFFKPVLLTSTFRNQTGHDIFASRSFVALSKGMPNIIRDAVDIENPFQNANYSHCVWIENTAFAQITWTSLNTSIYYYTNEKVNPLTTFTEITPETADLNLDRYERCLTLMFRESGVHWITVSVSLFGYVRDEMLLNISVKPTFSGLHILTNTQNNVVQRLWPVSFGATHNPYPLQLLYTWDFGDVIYPNLEKSELNRVHAFHYSGTYNVSLTVLHHGQYTRSQIQIEVKEAFRVYGPIEARAGVDLNEFTFESEFPLNSISIRFLEFSFGNGNVETFDTFISNSIQITTEQQYSTCGYFNVTVNVHLDDEGTSLVTVGSCLITIYEAITGVNIFIVPGEKSLVNHEFSLSASLATGSFPIPTYSWSSNDFQIRPNQAFVHVVSSSIRQQSITLEVSNKLYPDPVRITKSFWTGEALTNFTVVKPMHFVRVGQSVLFQAYPVGASNIQYKIYIEPDNRIMESSTNAIEITFSSIGVKSLRFDVIFGSSVENCNELSVIDCTSALKVHVQYQIEEIELSYVDVFGNTVISGGGVVYMKTDSDLSSTLTSISGSDVNLAMHLDGFQVTLVDLTSNHDRDFSATSKLPGILFWEATTHKLEVVASNGLGEVRRLYNVQVDELISFEITGNSVVELGSSFTLKSHLATGTNVEFKWNIQDQEIVTVENSVDAQALKIGESIVVCTASNPISTLQRHYPMFVVGSLKNKFLVLKTPGVTPHEQVIIEFGFVNGSLIGIFLYIDGQLLDMIGYGLSGTYNGSYSTSFPKTGVYKIKLVFWNPMLSSSEETTVLVQDPIGSITVEISPSLVMRAGEEVVFTVKVIGGSDQSGVLSIQTQDSIVIKDHILNFEPCPYVTYQCITANFTYTFSVGMIYVVKGYVENAVSSVGITPQKIFVVDLKQETVKSIQMIAESTPFGSPTKIHFIKRSGLEIEECSVNYGDGHKNILVDLMSLQEHIYHEPGQYQISLFCRTNYGIVEIDTMSYVQLPLQIASVSYPTEYVRFGDTFNISLKIADNTTLGQLKSSVMIKGSEKKPRVSIQDHILTIMVQQDDYMVSGETLEMVAIVRNFVSEADQIVRVGIMKAIERISCQTPSVWRYGVETVFRVQIESESVVDVELFYGDGDSHRLLNTSQSSIITRHLYKEKNVFDYQVQVKNKVSSLWFNSSISILQSINNVTFVQHAPLQWPDANVVFELEFSSTPSSSMELLYQVFFGDGSMSQSSVIPSAGIIGRRFQLPAYQYPLPGCYTPFVTLFNVLDSIALKGTLCITNFEQLDVEVTGKAVSSDSADSSLVQKFGDDQPIKIIIKNAASEWYTFRFLVRDVSTNEIVCDYTNKQTEMLIDSLIGESGDYKIAVTASIADTFKELGIVPFELLKVVPNTFLLPGSKGLVAKNKEFFLATLTNPESITSVEWNFGDSIVLSSTPEFKEVPPSHVLLAGSYRYFIKVQHSYKDYGPFSVSAKASNEISSVTSTLKLFISDVHCERPIVEILASQSGTAEFFYQKPVTVAASVRTDCVDRNKVFFKWEVYQSSKWEFDNKQRSVGKIPMS